MMFTVMDYLDSGNSQIPEIKQLAVWKAGENNFKGLKCDSMLRKIIACNLCNVQVL